MKKASFLQSIYTPLLVGMAVLLSATLFFTGCKDDEFYLQEEPALSVSPEGGIAMGKEGGMISFQVQSNRQWVIEAQSETTDWYKLSTEEGENNATVDISVSPNDGGERTLTLTISTATLSEQIFLIQGGAFSTTVIYTEDFGLATSSPYPTVSEYEGWNTGGTGADGVTYTSEGNKVDIRGNSASSGYTGASGGSNVMMAAAGNASFIINNIEISGSTGFDFFFGLSPANAALPTLAYSADGGEWIPITFDPGTTDRWGLISTSFELDAPASVLSIKFTAEAYQYGTRIDDLKLVGKQSGGGGNILRLTPSTFNPAVTGESTTVTITSNTDWTIVPDASADWCTVTSALTGTDNGSFTVTATANTGSQRTATIVVKTNDNAITRNFVVTQADANAPDEGDGSKGNPFSVSEAMAHQGAASNTDYKWVKGYIVGVVESGSPNTPNFDGPFTNQYNVFIADNPDETNTDNCVNVQLPAGDIRDELNLNTNPSNKGKQLILEGTLERYNTYPGVKNTRAYEWQSASGQTLSLSTEEENPGAAAGSFTVNVTSNASWTVSPDASNPWCTVTPASGSNNGSFTVSYTANDGTMRVAVITVSTSDGELTRTVTVTQTGANSNDGTYEKPYSIPEAIAHQGSVGNTDYKWVKGYIVGVVESGSPNTPNFDGPFTNPYNVFIADNPDETNTDNCVNVQLPAGNVRDNLNLHDNPSNKNKLLILEGTLDKYNTYPGVKNTRTYEWLSATGSTLNIAPDNFTAEAEQSAQTITVTSNTSWVVVPDAANPWCTVSPASGNNDGTFVVSVAANTGAQRAATLTVNTTDDAVSRQLIVVQNAAVGTGATSLTENWETGTNNGTAAINGWSFVKVLGDDDKIWDVRTYSNNKYAQASAHQGTAANYELWLISPALDISGAAQKLMSFATKGGYFIGTSSLEVYVMDDDTPSASKTKLTARMANDTDPLDGSYTTWIPSGNIDLSSFSGIKHIGFRYVADGGNNNSATYQLDEFVFGSATSNNLLAVVPGALNFAAEGENKTFIVNSNTAWTVTVPAEASAWCSINTTSGTDNGTITVTATANTGSEQRSATLTVSGTDVASQTVVVTQSGTGGSSAINLVLNHSFEDFAGAIPANWTTSSSSITKITENAYDGDNALKLASNGGTARLEQTIGDIEAGATYKISFWYKDNTKGSTAQGIRLWSNFKNGSSNITPVNNDKEALQPSATLEAVTEWTKYEVTVVAPDTATNFLFGIRATNGYEGIIDNCSFTKEGQ